MCLFQSSPPPPAPPPPAPPPPAPPPPSAPKPLPDDRPVLKEEVEDTKPRVEYGRKKKSSVRSRRGTDSLRIPLTTIGQTTGSSGGLNIQGGNNV